MSAASGPLPARVAYRLWAPTYEHENVMTALDELAVSILDPVPPPRGAPPGRRLRDRPPPAREERRGRGPRRGHDRRG